MKKTILSALLFASLSAFAQNNFHDELEFWGHKYKAVVNTDLFAKWVLAEEKSWYLAPDSTDSRLMTDVQWAQYRKELKTKGFNELDSDYYWNPKTRTVVMLDKERHRNGMLHVSTEYGTDIR